MRQIIERLRVCWYVLTMRNFLFFAYSKKMIRKQGEYYELMDKSIHGFYHIDNVVFEKGVPTLRHLICDNVIHIVNKIKTNSL